MERIKLTEKEVEYLNDFVKRGRKSVRELTRAHLLLQVNDGKTEREVKNMLRISRATVSNIKKRYYREGLQCALTEKPRYGQPKKYTETHEAEVIAQACTESPDGRKRWTLILLTEEMRKMNGFETINKECIRFILKKAKLNLG